MAPASTVFGRLVLSAGSLCLVPLAVYKTAFPGVAGLGFSYALAALALPLVLAVVWRQPPEPLSPKGAYYRASGVKVLIGVEASLAGAVFVVLVQGADTNWLALGICFGAMWLVSSLFGLRIALGRRRQVPDHPWTPAQMLAGVVANTAAIMAIPAAVGGTVWALGLLIAADASSGQDRGPMFSPDSPWGHPKGGFFWILMTLVSIVGSAIWLIVYLVDRFTVLLCLDVAAINDQREQARQEDAEN